jgi:hypothetical protein
VILFFVLEVILCSWARSSFWFNRF